MAVKVPPMINSKPKSVEIAANAEGNFQLRSFAVTGASTEESKIAKITGSKPTQTNFSTNPARASAATMTIKRHEKLVRARPYETMTEVFLSTAGISVDRFCLILYC